MTGPELTRIDDVLIRWGVVLLLVWIGLAVALVLLAQEGAAPGLPIAPLATVLVAGLVAPIAMLVVGRRLRRRERRAWSLMRLVDAHVEIRAVELIRDSDFTAATLRRAIRDLNNAGLAWIVWDPQSGMIQDGRLRQRHVEVSDCRACGARVSLWVSLADLAAARCPYCEAAFGPSRAIAERERLIAEQTDRAVEDRAGAGLGSDFSLPVFVVLSLLFWPLGLLYALWHWRAAAPAT